MTEINAAKLSEAKRALLQQRIRGQGAASGRSQPVARARTDKSALSVVQETVWYFSQLAPGNPVYNEAVTIRKRGALDLDAFCAAFNEVVRRHDVWHATFQVIDGEPLQVVSPTPAWELPVVDFGGLSTADAEREATRLAAGEAMRPYDLMRGPLLRPMLVRFAADDHRLYLALHQLIFDGGSLSQTILPELIALYDAFAIGDVSPLPSDPVQYAEYAAWEREWTAGSEFAKRLGYWRQHLAGAPPLELPLDHARPARQTFRGATEPMHICAESAQRLRELSHRNGATLFQTLASVFAVLLHGYSGQDDIVFGTVANLRQRLQHEHVVGYCVTRLVLRAYLGDDPAFIELLSRVRGDIVDALDNTAPFERIVRELHPVRVAGVNLICQAVLVLMPKVVAPAASWSVDLLATEVHDAIGHAKFDLAVELDERPDGDIAGRILFNTDVFDRETIRRMRGHWDTLLEGVIADPTRPISELPLLTEAERHRQLVEWNATEAYFPRDSCLHDLVAEQVQRTPDAIAVTDSFATLSFATLNAQATRLAAHLRERGVGPDVLVGVCMERSVDMVVALLAVLKAGGAYVPLEPDHPRLYLAMMVDDARPAAIVTTAGLCDRLPPSSASVVLVDKERPTWMSHAPVDGGDAGPTNVAYVLYTSGSTGQPKGVMIEHRSIVNQLVWRVGRFGLGPGDRVLQKTPLGFDVSLWEVFCPLISGATVVMLDPRDHVDPLRIAATVRTERITALDFVPSMLQTFLDTIGADGCESVRLVATGGERLTTALCQRFFECFGPEVELCNHYGPTEATVNVTSWRCDPGAAVVPIGRPVANTTIYLLGADDRPVPVGLVGELCIGGVQVARGYLNRPRLTGERFVANPFRAGERIYRTGDRARYRNDGTIEYLGRIDDQVKIRGFRIELDEIETALLADEGIASAVAVARDDTPGDRTLVAYVVPKGEPPSSAQLRELLRRTLPHYMVPAAFVTLDALPLMPNGKVNRTALPAPEWKPVLTTQVAPRTAVEERLTSVWARILHVDRVGVNDDFFEVGGHSLLAIQLLVEVEGEFGVKVPLAAFFEGGVTVAGLAADIEAARGAEVADRLTIPVRPHGTAPILFFVHADESSLLTLRHFTGPLGPDQRVMGLLPERIDRRFDRSRGIEKLALPMLATVRETQPEGPYFLAGFSLGGLLAYEMAGRLRAAGEEVAWLGVIDAATPAAGARRIQQQRISWRRRAAEQWERGIQDAARRTTGYLRRELNRWLVGARLRSSKMSDEFDWRGARALANRYACSGHDATMDLFVTDENAADTADDSLGWDDIHRGVLRLHRVHGDHLSIVTEPDVVALANLVTECLRQARSMHELLVS